MKVGLVLMRVSERKNEVGGYCRHSRQFLSSSKSKRKEEILIRILNYQSETIGHQGYRFHRA